MGEEWLGESWVREDWSGWKGGGICRIVDDGRSSNESVLVVVTKQKVEHDERRQRTDNSVVLPQLQIIPEVLELLAIGLAAAVVGQVLDVETLLDQVVVEEGVGLAVFAGEAQFGGTSGGWEV